MEAVRAIAEIVDESFSYVSGFAAYAAQPLAVIWVGVG
jgi:hypothetical protein